MIRPGYVYAIKPDGLDRCKVGATNNPRSRGQAIAAFSPVPMSFVALIRVRSQRDALTYERIAIHRLQGNEAHGEWFDGVERVKAVLSELPGTDCVADFSIPVAKPRVMRPMSEDFVAFALELNKLREEIDGSDFTIAERIGLKPTVLMTANGTGKTPKGFWEAVAQYRQTHSVPSGPLPGLNPRSPTGQTAFGAAPAVAQGGAV